MMWGKLKENGIWIARTSHWRYMWCNHDSLYMAIGRLRVRLMKP